MMRLKPWEITLCVMVALFLAIALFHSTISKSQSCVDGSPVSAFSGATLCGAWPTIGLAKQGRATTDTSGFYAWTFPAQCLNGGNIPGFSVIAEGPTPQAGINANVQVEGAPTATGVNLRVTKTTSTTVALLGLTITVAATGTGVGATVLDLTCDPQ